MKEPSVVYNIKNKYHELSNKEKLIADYIIENPTRCVNPTIDRLAKAIGISEATLVRFVRKLGYKGYSAFRIELAKDSFAEKTNFFDIDLDSSMDPIDTVFSHTIKVLEATASAIDKQAVHDVAGKIACSRRLLLLGMGGSNISAKDAYHKFLRTGIDCQFAEDFHIQLMLASQTREGDCALVFSHLGSNYDTISMTQELKDRGCTVVVVTCYSNSPLARIGDYKMVAQSADLKNSPVQEAYTASIAIATMINILYVEVFKLLQDEGLDCLNSMRRTIAKRRS